MAAAARFVLTDRAEDSGGIGTARLSAPGACAGEQALVGYLLNQLTKIPFGRGVIVFDDSRPLFQQVADLLADGIVTGRYPEDTQVPSTNELSAFYRINPATVGKGVSLLVEQGILHKRRGLGMFVSPGSRARLLADRTASFRQNFVAPLLREARQLGLSTAQLRKLLDQEDLR